jgi:cellulose synthase/poly-beta-1,6-N-acetylglucosamine synthase-like glycosyltransferase
MKILIAVPTFETIEPEVFKAIYELKSEHELHFEFVKGYDCAIARNAIARLAQEDGYDYVLMVDSDTIIPPETLEYMLDPPADVVLGVCPRKNTRNGKTAMTRFVPLQYREDYYYSDLPSERTLIKGGGFACALVKSNVFTRMDYPWFQYTLTADGTTLSEDYYFCQNARMFGIDVYMEPRVKCGHLARYFQYE